MSTTNHIALPLEFKNTMIVHARKELPNECCGVLTGRHGKIERAIPMTSTQPSPDSYFMDPEEQIQVYSEMEKKGESLLGIYHSHPEGPSHPSGLDIQLAFHPDAVYFIVSLKDRTKPEVRAFRIQQQNVTEIMINLVA